MIKVKKAVILCGGFATRFLPISKSVPKEMLPILDKPILQIIVEDLAKAGITDIFILLNRGKECIPNHFDKNLGLEQKLIDMNCPDLLEIVRKPNNLANIVYKRQDEPRGTGYGVQLAKGFVGDDPFVFMFGDEVMFCDGKNVVEQILETYYKENKNVIAVKEVPMSEVFRYGIIDKGNSIENGYDVKGIVEKPKVEDAPSNISYIGPAVLTKEVFPALDRLPACEKGKEIILTNAFKFLADDGRLCARLVEGDRHDVGNKFGYVKANMYACLKDNEFKNDMEKLILKIADEIKGR